MEVYKEETRTPGTLQRYVVKWDEDSLSIELSQNGKIMFRQQGMLMKGHISFPFDITNTIFSICSNLSTFYSNYRSKLN